MPILMGPDSADPLVVEVDFAPHPAVARTSAASARRGKRRTSTSEVRVRGRVGCRNRGVGLKRCAGGASWNIKLGAARYDRQDSAEHWLARRSGRGRVRNY